MINELLNKEKMNETISRKGNLFTPGLAKLTYFILKNKKDDATDLLVNIMNMMIGLDLKIGDQLLSQIFLQNHVW
jgi:hypothetical protein